MEVGIYSFAHIKLNNNIPFYQKQVFSKFDLNINHYIADCYHGEALNKIIHGATEDYIIIFDIDCIPLNKSFYNTLLSEIKDGNTLSGGTGCALHKDPITAYIHPCFFGFKKSLYYDCGAPDLMHTRVKNKYCALPADTAQNFTHQCRRTEKKLKFWNITHSNDITWESPALNLKWGHGTVFEHTIYHQYQIRRSSQQKPFIQKCKEILNN